MLVEACPQQATRSHDSDDVTTLSKLDSELKQFVNGVVFRLWNKGNIPVRIKSVGIDLPHPCYEDTPKENDRGVSVASCGQFLIEPGFSHNVTLRLLSSFFSSPLSGIPRSHHWLFISTDQLAVSYPLTHLHLSDFQKSEAESEEHSSGCRILSTTPNTPVREEKENSSDLLVFFITLLVITILSGVIVKKENWTLALPFSLQSSLTAALVDRSAIPTPTLVTIPVPATVLEKGTDVKPKAAKTRKKKNKNRSKVAQPSAPHAPAENSENLSPKELAPAPEDSQIEVSHEDNHANEPEGRNEAPSDASFSEESRQTDLPSEEATQEDTDEPEVAQPETPEQLDSSEPEAPPALAPPPLASPSPSPSPSMSPSSSPAPSPRPLTRSSPSVSRANSSERKSKTLPSKPVPESKKSAAIKAQQGSPKKKAPGPVTTKIIPSKLPTDIYQLHLQLPSKSFGFGIPLNAKPIGEDSRAQTAISPSTQPTKAPAKEHPSKLTNKPSAQKEHWPLVGSTEPKKVEILNRRLSADKKTAQSSVPPKFLHVMPKEEPKKILLPQPPLVKSQQLQKQQAQSQTKIQPQLQLQPQQTKIQPQLQIQPQPQTQTQTLAQAHMQTSTQPQKQVNVQTQTQTLTQPTQARTQQQQQQQHTQRPSRTQSYNAPQVRREELKSEAHLSHSLPSNTDKRAKKRLNFSDREERTSPPTSHRGPSNSLYRENNKSKTYPSYDKLDNIAFITGGNPRSRSSSSSPTSSPHEPPASQLWGEMAPDSDDPNFFVPYGSQSSLHPFAPNPPVEDASNLHSLWNSLGLSSDDSESLLPSDLFFASPLPPSSDKKRPPPSPTKGSRLPLFTNFSQVDTPPPASPATPYSWGYSTSTTSTSRMTTSSTTEGTTTKI